MKPLCIYHGGCDDGFGAALAVDFAFDQGVELYPGIYQEPPPDVTGRHVIMVDFSYKRDVVEKIKKSCRSLTLLDHHKSAEEDLQGVLGRAPATWLERVRVLDENPHCALFDMNRSGAVIAWEYFHPTTDVPLFYRYLQDRDLWKKQLVSGDEFTIALRSYPQNLTTWRQLLGTSNLVPHLIAEGRTILRYYRCRVEELKATAIARTIAGYAVPTVNAPYFAASEVAGELAEDVVFAACYFYRGTGWQFSLRSKHGFDVSEVAKKFGGGGHAAAAGFTVAALPWGDGT